MAIVSDAANAFAADARALDAARLRARQDPAEGTRFAAKQFEALFLGMVLKAMREATPKGGLFDNEATKLYGSMLDQQLAQSLTAKGGLGFARMVEQQLARQAGATVSAPPGAGALDAVADVLVSAPVGEFPELPFGPAGRDSRVATALAAYGRMGRTQGRMISGNGGVDEPLGLGQIAGSRGQAILGMDSMPEHVQSFVRKAWPHALEASRLTGVPPQFMMAQAALETGWGRSEPREADGTPSYNLFGIKAGAGWSGPSLEAATTEVENGQARRTSARFRAYGSYAESFMDYARLLTTNPRYAGVLNQQDPTAFARALQSAGYATDPAYADKISRIIRGSFQTAYAG